MKTGREISYEGQKLIMFTEEPATKLVRVADEIFMRNFLQKNKKNASFVQYRLANIKDYPDKIREFLIS